MSIRGFMISTVVGCLVSGAWCALALAEASSPASRPSGASAVAESPVRVGAVHKALERLFTIPRPATQPAAARTGLDFDERFGQGRATAGHRLGLQHDDAIRESVSSVPIGSQDMEHRLGLQHADAIRHSSSSVPIGETTREAEAGDEGPVSDKSALMPREGVGKPPPVFLSPYQPGYLYLHSRPPRRLSQGDREWANYNYFGGRPGRYGYGLNDPYADDAAGDVYRFGFQRGYRTGRFDRTGTERSERLLARSRGHLDRGLEAFREGQYRAAADAFKLAAETDQGDPAARLYAAHALFATGRYRDAVKYLRRAFELQPKIVFLDFDMRDDYGKRADFDEHVASLENALERSPRNVDRLILLGYVRYYSHQRDGAYEALAKAHRVDRRDPLVARLLENCNPPDVVEDELQRDEPGT